MRPHIRTVVSWLAYLAALWLGRESVLPGGTLAVLWPAAGMAALWFAQCLTDPARLTAAIAVMLSSSVTVSMATGVDHRLAVRLAACSLMLNLGYAWAIRRWMNDGLHLSTPLATARLLLICWVGAAPPAVLMLIMTSPDLGSAHQCVLLLGSFTARLATGAFTVIACAVPLLRGQVARDLRSDAANRWLLPVLMAVVLLETVMHDALGFPALLLLLGLQVTVATWFSQTLTAWSVALTSTVLVVQTRIGGGPFSLYDPLRQAAYTQIYLGVLAGVVLLQSAFRVQRDDLVAAVSRTAHLSERRLAVSRESERLYRMAFDRAPVGAFVVGLTDGDLGRILRANAETALMLGVDGPRGLVDRPLLEWVVPHQRELLADRIRDELDGTCAGEEMDIRFRGTSGREVVLRLVTSRISPAVTDDSYLLVLAEDVTALRLAQERLEQQALHDTLTQLPNRRLFTDRLGEAMAAAVRGPGPVGVLYLDLDGFKQVNDTYGHAAGDDLLRHVSRRLRDVTRPGDTVARLGGDEFALLCPQITADGLRLVADRIVRTVREPVHLPGGVVVGVGTSVGGARSRPGQSVDDLVHEADVAMYEAKRAGRGGVRLVEREVKAVPRQRGADAAYR